MWKIYLALTIASIGLILSPGYLSGTQ